VLLLGCSSIELEDTSSSFGLRWRSPLSDSDSSLIRCQLFSHRDCCFGVCCWDWSWIGISVTHHCYPVLHGAWRRCRYDGSDGVRSKSLHSDLRHDRWSHFPERDASSIHANALNSSHGHCSGVFWRLGCCKHQVDRDLAADVKLVREEVLRSKLEVHVDILRFRCSPRFCAKYVHFTTIFIYCAC
jgi:hypothetical protein